MRDALKYAADEAMSDTDTDDDDVGGTEMQMIYHSLRDTINCLNQIAMVTLQPVHHPLVSGKVVGPPEYALVEEDSPEESAPIEEPAAAEGIPAEEPTPVNQEVYSCTSTVFVASTDQQFILEAGQAHGVYKGDEYDLYPFWTPDNIAGLSPVSQLRAKVVSVGPTTSKLEVVDLPSTCSAVLRGWKARSVVRHSPRRILVGLMPSIENPSCLVSACQERVSFQIVEEPSKSHPCTFHVGCDQNKQYEILDADYKALPGIAPISSSHSRSVDRLMDILDHLALFTYFEGIEASISDPSFLKSFTLEIRDSHGTLYEIGETLNVSEQQKLTVTIRNLSKDKTLYLTVLNFSPSWQIHNLSGGAGGPGFDAVPPRDQEAHGNRQPCCTGASKVSFAMVVPEHLKRLGQCEDGLRIIVASTPTSFQSLLMPNITEVIASISRGQYPPLHVPSIPAMPHSQGRQETHLCDEELAIFNVMVRTHC
jgi:hypothetical protein